MPTQTTRIPLGEDGHARLDIRRGRRWATVILDLWPSNFNLVEEGHEQGRRLIEEYMDGFKHRCQPAGTGRIVGFPRHGVAISCGPSLVHLGPIPKEDAQRIADMFTSLLEPANLEDCNKKWQHG